jgi:general secretion pathway protein K
MTKQPGVRQQERGFALMAVVWIITLLSVIVLSFAAMAKTDVYATMGFKESMEQKYLAEAGIQGAVVELMHERALKMQNAADTTAMIKTDRTAYTRELGTGSYTFRVTDESGKIDINALTDKTGALLSNLLRNFGSSEEEANTIVDSILDWKDTDDAHRLNGAENNYYMSLPAPYRAKNAGFETLEELILVKGMTRDVLYGNEKRKGIIHFITVHSGAATVNMNTAPKEVLTAIPHMTEGLADTIFARHGANVMASQQDLAEVIGDSYKEMLNYASLGGGSNTLTIESVGHKAGKKTGFGVKAVITLDANGSFRYLYYKCPSTGSPQ